MFMPLRDLELRHLAALDAVATEGTFGRAALRLGYTQSAVSQQIAALERLVGAALFDRPGGPRPVELTPLGDLLLEHALARLAREGREAGASPIAVAVLGDRREPWPARIRAFTLVARHLTRPPQVAARSAA